MLLEKQSNTVHSGHKSTGDNKKLFPDGTDLDKYIPNNFSIIMDETI